MNKKIIDKLKSCNLKMAAFDMKRHFSGKVLKNEIAQAMTFFIKVPCVETAVNLISVYPEISKVMFLSNDVFTKNTPKENRGAAYDGLDECMAMCDKNLLNVSNIQSYLLEEATKENITIGFHSLRDQAILLERLKRVGIKKGFFSNKRQFLRDRITQDMSAFYSVLDLICIHGIHNGRELFWDALGNDADPQCHLHSEIQYDLSLNVEPLLSVLNKQGKYD